MTKSITQHITNRYVIRCNDDNTFRTEHWGKTIDILNARIFSKVDALICVDDAHTIYPISKVTLELDEPLDKLL